LTNETVIITGGASGLGLNVAEALLEEGAEIVIFDLNDKLFSELSEKFDCYKVDVTDESSVQSAVNDVIGKYGKIDVLVNSAGIIHSAPLINIMNPNGMRHSFTEFKEVLDVDLCSVFLVSSIISEKMILKRTRGVIINISSICARGNAGQTAYAAAKAGVEAMTKVWAKELGTFGIRTNAIAPGFIDTPSTAKSLNQKNIENIVKNTPLNTLGRPENISMAVAYIIKNDFVNGAVVEVNGGLIL